MHFLHVLLAGVSIASACSRNASSKQESPLVVTKVGSVMGKYVKGFDTVVAAFLGIPFATAPIRFAKPQAAKPWKGVLIATDKPPQCPQNPKGKSAEEGTYSEDCLYLNVWSPSGRCCDTTRKLPVLVWIYGGAFISGSSAMDLHDGRVLASYGDVVVVTFNYRVGAFGFLSSGTEEAPGNAGFYDQVMALEWVRDNIEQFGGDPNKVTVFGQSAGSMSASGHQVSPLSRGLFRRIVMMSETAYQPYILDTPATAQSKLKLFSEAVGCSGGNVTLQDNMAQVIQCLRDKDAGTLLRGQKEVVPQFHFFFRFFVGGEAFPKHPIDAYDSGDVAQVEVMTGVMKDEGTFFLNKYLPEVFPADVPPNVSLDQVDAIISQLLPMKTPSPETVKEFYFRNVTETDKLQIVRTIAYIYGDVFFNCPPIYLAEKLKSVYFYWNTHRSKKEKAIQWFGSTHVSDVAYVFGHPIVDNSNYTREDRSISEYQIQKLVQFARTGNPVNPDMEEDWPEFDSKNHRVHVYKPMGQNIEHPRLEKCEFWRPYIAKVAQN